MTLERYQRDHINAARVLTHREVDLALVANLSQHLYVPEAWRGDPGAASQALIACLLRTCKALYAERESLAGLSGEPADVVPRRSG